MNDSGTYLWRLSPVARPDDPTWQGRRIWSELQIVAISSGEALILAARFALGQANEHTRGSQDRQQLRSGFEDERLYRIDRLDTRPPCSALSGHVMLARLLSPEASPGSSVIE